MMHLKKKEGTMISLILSCPKCGYENKATRPNLFIKQVDNCSRENLVIIGKKEQRFRTSPTFAISCTKCGSNRAYGWSIDLGSLERSSTQFYRCIKCNYTSRDTG